MQHTSRPDRRQTRQETIRQLLKAHDSTIRSVEFLYDPWPGQESETLVSCDVWLYRKGQTPVMTTVVFDLAEQKILHMEAQP